MSSKKLIVVLGPTAVGKTAHSVRLAQHYHTEIISCDSRQFYRELNIGVARPSVEELASAPHHFIACRSVLEPYNAWQYAHDALQLLEQLFQHHDVVIAVGGSGLYVDALCQGIAVLPDPAPELRQQLSQQILDEGVEPLCQRLQLLDPDYYAVVDRNNPARIQRALEVCLTTGKPYSQLLKQEMPERPFQIEKQILYRDRDILRDRISLRVDRMVEEGLLSEAEMVCKYRTINTLNTVGYKELFAYMDGALSLPKALQQIKDHTWQYAKKQLSWLRRPSQKTIPTQWIDLA